MKQIDSPSCEAHRKELLRFLLIKTAAVRRRIKPAELLRVSSCYRLADPSSREAICLYQCEILRELQLSFKILRTDAEQAMVLFYDSDLLRQTLQDKALRLYLNRKHGYPATADLAEHLHCLQQRFAGDEFPHEVGIFIGYPLKDVAGFIHRTTKQPVHRSGWQVFGSPEKSLRLMKQYRFVEFLAGKILEKYQDLEKCLEKITNLNLNSMPGI